MKIRTHMGVSIDGFVATADGRPSLLSVPTFVGGESHGHPEFIADCGAVLMGRTTLDPALQAPPEHWPWTGYEVFVLTSRPLPDDAPAGIVTSSDPAELLEKMRAAGFDGDVHLVGGPQTIAAFRELDALDRLGLVVLPILLGDGLPLAASGTGLHNLTLESQRTFEDGSVELNYV
jgi:dihydrofolate reductase